VCSAANVCLIILTKSFTRTALRLEANYIKSQVVSAYCSPIYRVGLVPAKSNKNNISLRVGLCLECPNFTGKVRPKQQKIVVNVGVEQYHCKAHLAYIGPLSLSLCVCVHETSCTGSPMFSPQAYTPNKQNQKRARILCLKLRRRLPAVKSEGFAPSSPPSSSLKTSYLVARLQTSGPTHDFRLCPERIN
jgi:hypothetical protein